MAQCPRCNGPLGTNDYLPGQSAACPQCGTAGAPVSDQPWWVSSAPVTETVESQALTSTQTTPTTAAKPELDSLEFEMPPTAPPPPKLVESVAVTATRSKEPRPPVADDDEEEFRGSFLARQYAQLKRLDACTLLAFFLGSMALFLNSIDSLSFLTKWLSVGGLALGVLGGVAPALVRMQNVLFPIVMSLLCLCDVLFVGSWPESPPPPPPPNVAIPLHKGGLAAPQPIADNEWVDASENAVQRSELRVRIASVRIGNIELKELKKEGAKPFQSRERYLAIFIEATYETKVFQSLPYASWADEAKVPSQHPPTVTDNLEKAYAQKTVDPRFEVVGREDKSFITPCGPSPEVLMFSTLPANVEYLRLKLPAAAFGRPGEFRFQIPRSMIKELPPAGVP